MPETSPDSLTHKQHLVATLLVSGLEVAEVAKRVSLAPSRIRKWEKLPEMIAVMDHYRTQFLSGVAQNLEQKLVAEGPRTLQRALELRDQSDNLGVAGTMTKELLDRHLPKKTFHEEEKHIHIHLSREDQQRGTKVLEEMKAIDVSPS